MYIGITGCLIATIFCLKILVSHQWLESGIGALLIVTGFVERGLIHAIINI